MAERVYRGYKRTEELDGTINYKAVSGGAEICIEQALEPEGTYVVILYDSHGDLSGQNATEDCLGSKLSLDEAEAVVKRAIDSEEEAIKAENAAEWF